LIVDLIWRMEHKEFDAEAFLKGCGIHDEEDIAKYVAILQENHLDHFSMPLLTLDLLNRMGIVAVMDAAKVTSIV